MAVRVVDALEVVEVDDGDAERRAGESGGLDLAPQHLLRAAVVEQPGEPVGGGLVAQVLALAGGGVGERGHRREALDERHLGVREGAVVARPVDVEGADHAVVGEQRHADERLVVVGGPRDDGAERVEAAVGDVARAAVADDPAGDAAVDRERLGHDLVDPGAEREHGPQRLAVVLDLVDGEVVVRQQGLQVVRDPPERVLQRVGGQDPGCGIDEGVQRSAAPLRRRLLGDHTRCIDPRTRRLDRLSGRGVAFVACGTSIARPRLWCASGDCRRRSAGRRVRSGGWRLSSAVSATRSGHLNGGPPRLRPSAASTSIF